MTGEPPQPAHRTLTSLMRALLRDDVAEARALLGKADIDFPAMGTLLDKSRLSGYLYTLVADTGLVGLLPPWLLDQLVAGYRRQLGKSADHLVLVEKLRLVLGEASIPFVTIKGLYLAQRFYGDIRRRFMSDVDILVPSGELGAAVTAVAQLGFYPAPGISVDPRNPFWGIHAVEVRGNCGVLDIHHVIRKLPGINFDYEGLWNNANEFTIDDSRLVSLCDTDTLLIATVGLGADIQNSHHNLRKIWDIYMILRQLDAAVDWADFFSLREREGSLKLVLNVFAFCLLLAAATDDCPSLGRAMSAHSRLILIKNTAQAETIFTRNRQHLANRMLFSRLLPVSSLHYWLRWLVTLPARVWHYRRTMPGH